MIMHYFLLICYKIPSLEQTEKKTTLSGCDMKEYGEVQRLGIPFARRGVLKFKYQEKTCHKSCMKCDSTDVSFI